MELEFKGTRKMIKSDEVTRFRNTTNFSGREVLDFNKATVKPALIKLTTALDVLFIAIGLFMYFELYSLIAGLIFGCMAIIFPLIMPFAYKKIISKNAQANPFCSSNTFLDYRFVERLKGMLKFRRRPLTIDG